MIDAVKVKTYTHTEADIKAIMRYAQCVSADAQVENLVRVCLQECEFSYKICYREFSIKECNGVLDLSFCNTNSKALKKLLSNSKRVLVFAATIGFDIDRRITKYSKIDPAKALIFQAIGTERVESLCDAFEEDIRHEKGYDLTSRFSPGYADLPLEIQKDLFRALDCYKHIGVTLNDSLLMSPSKTVTAIIGTQG